MQSPIRAFLLMLTAVLGVAASASAFGQKYPDKPIRVIIPNSTGSSPDAVARIIAPAMGKALGQPIVIDYKAGAGGVLGLEYVAKGVPADGYTVLFSLVTDQATFPIFAKDLRFDPLKDVVPVLAIAEGALLLASPIDTPWKTFNEMVAYAKANPGKLNFGTPGIQTSTSLQAEAIKQRLGLDIVSVPYTGGGPFIAAIVAGQVQLGWMNVLSAGGVGKGRVKVLAATGDTREPAYPDAPTFSEVGLPRLSGSFYALYVPAATPKNVIDTLNAAGNQALQQQEVKDALGRIGFRVRGGTPEVPAQMLADLARFYAEIAKNLRTDAR